MSGVDPAALQEAVLAWSGRTRRDLPWRRTRDPWSVLVSELMLQQTQVARVAPRYGSFLDRFPDPASCAAAPVGAVVEAWAGLGYNRRAVYLHRAATALVERHGGRLPDRLEDLTALPGIGAHTARAVLAFAFERDHGVVETNVARVLARAVSARPLGAHEAQSWADALVPPGRAWSWNQALVDLGAMVCVARTPRCGQCPLAERRLCAWLDGGRPLPDPAEGSAGTSGRQSTFAGSDRQGRGRLVDALLRGPVPLERIAVVAGWPDDPARAARVAAGLVADGLAVREPGALTLPGTAAASS
ncbi:MAG TPA: A/G-specific adenine glycosylase [Acidimicrobiales bacterium]